MEEKSEIKVIGLLTEYLLSPEEYKKHIGNRAENITTDEEGHNTSEPSNLCAFKQEHFPKIYSGTFVAYYEGVLIGQSKNRNVLYQKALELYEPSSFINARGDRCFKTKWATEFSKLGVFKVPDNYSGSNWKKAMEESIGNLY